MDIKDITNNIVNTYDNSPISVRTNGIQWYLKAHNYCLELSNRYNLSLDLVVAILAVLSPRNKWESNKEDCETLIKAYFDKLDLDQFKVKTFNANKQKAWEILKTQKVVLTGNKVTAFYYNIRYPVKSEEVTVDTWAVRVALNNGSYSKPITNKQYKIIAEGYREAFKTLKGKYKYLTTPMQVQAVCWEHIRTST